jgi:hypothetical protein
VIAPGIVPGIASGTSHKEYALNVSWLSRGRNSVECLSKPFAGVILLFQATIEVLYLRARRYPGF